MFHRGLLSNTLVGAKRTRREFEPDTKGFNDEALEMPWEDLQLASADGYIMGKLRSSTFDDKDVIESGNDDSLLYMGRKVQALSSFLIKNIYFFSHATEVQAHTVPIFRQPGNSIVVEAATGSGKTLAFLLPVFERILFSCHSVVSTLSAPILSRDIISVVLSPSRMLATQTFVVAKKFSTRLPFGVNVSLCDGLVEPAEKVLMHLRRQRRGVGTVLITTPGDLSDLVRLMRTSDLKEIISGCASRDDEETKEAMNVSKYITGDRSFRSEETEGELTTTRKAENISCKRAITNTETEKVREDVIECGQNNQTKIMNRSSVSFARMRGVFSKMVAMGALNNKFCTVGVNHVTESSTPLHASTSKCTSGSSFSGSFSGSSVLQPLPFVLVIDEADVILKAPNMRRQLEEFMEYLNEVLQPSSVEEEVVVVAEGLPNIENIKSEEKENIKMTHSVKSKNKKNKKLQVMAAENDAIHVENKCLPKVDVGLFGATVGSSANVTAFVKAYTSTYYSQKKGNTGNLSNNEPSTVAVEKKGKGAVAAADEQEKLIISTCAEQTTQQNESLSWVILHTDDDFISMLHNQYVVTPASQYLHTLIHLLNLHPNRKHFIFFDSIPMLLYVRAIMEHLVKKGGDGTGTSLSDPNKKKKQKQCVSAADCGVVSYGSSTDSNGLERKAVLYVSKIFSMHEDMNENTKFNEYNGFLEHNCGSGGDRVSAAGASSLTNKIFAHKRDRLIRTQEKAASNNSNHTRLSESSVSMAEQKNARYAGGLKKGPFNSTGSGAVLLCTDEAAFGLDVRDVDYVYHAEAPRSVRSYIHRIGRVGRMGMRGCSIMILVGSGANDSENYLNNNDNSSTPNTNHHIPLSTSEEGDTYNRAGAYRTLANSRTGGKLLSEMSAGSLASRRGHTAQKGIDALNHLNIAATSQEEADMELSMLLTQKQNDFFQKLKAARNLERYKLPHVAPLTTTLRAVIAGDPTIVKLGRRAAMALTRFRPLHEQTSLVSESLVDKVGRNRQTQQGKDSNEIVIRPDISKDKSEGEDDDFCWFSPKTSLEALLLSQ